MKKSGLLFVFGIGLFLLTISSVSAYNLNVNWRDGRYGNVNVTPQGIIGGGGCGQLPSGEIVCNFIHQNYTNGTSVSLRAVTINNGRFLGWNGACSGTNSVCWVIMSANKFVNATFAASQNNTNQTHLECRNNTCSIINGSGTNLCSPQGSVCGTTNQTRLTCVNNMCTRVNGTGNNTCSPQGSACGTTNQTHLECRSNTCSVVNGSGNNLCSPPGSICGVTNQTHRVCSTNRTCITVTGNGTNLCNTNNDCYPVTNKYLSPEKAKYFNVFGFFKRIFGRS